MRHARGSMGAGPRQDPARGRVHGAAPGRPPESLRPEEELEPLVLAVCALDGEQAALLLEGLADPGRTRALAALERWQRRRRAQRHAALESTFGARVDSGSAGEVPGTLGENLRAVLAGESTPPSCLGPIERWARRLALEHGSRD